MRTAIVVGAALALLAGCTTVYTKPGASNEDWVEDRQFCEVYARSMNENRTWSRGITQNRYRDSCLRERGWKPQTADPAPTPTAYPASPTTSQESQP